MFITLAQGYILVKVMSSTTFKLVPVPEAYNKRIELYSRRIAMNLLPLNSNFTCCLLFHFGVCIERSRLTIDDLIFDKRRL